MKKPHVVFINPPTMPLDKMCGREDNYLPLSMPLGLLYLSSSLKQFSEVGKVELIDYSLHSRNSGEIIDVQEFVREMATQSVSAHSPDILAFSVIFSTQHAFTMQAVTELKGLWPNATTVLGGLHPTNSVQMLLEDENVDFVARGEGELGFAEFVNRFANGQSLDVQGFYSSKILSESGTAPVKQCVLPEDLDELPHPDWELLDMEAYITASIARSKNLGGSPDARAASIMTSRGCPFQCTFCASHSVHGRTMRYRSNDNVADEVEQLYDQYKVTLLVPEDDLFTVHKPRILSLLDRMKTVRVPDMELLFPNALSINTLDEDVIDALQEAGMGTATLAVESGSEYVQTHLIKKRCDLKRARRIVTYCRSKGLYTRTYFILGFPGETREQMQETIDLARELQSDWSVFMIAVPLLGSEMYDQFLEQGAFTHDDGTWASVYFERRFDTEDISAEELNALAYAANLDVNFVNNPALANSEFERGVEVFRDVVISYPFHIIGRYCLAKCLEGVGKYSDADSEWREIHRLIETDERAHAMYETHGHLIEEFHITEFPTDAATVSSSALTNTELRSTHMAARR